MRVVFSNRAYISVLAETTEKIKTETGGLFLGTMQDDTWYILESIDPGPNSIFEVAYFEYDQKYTQHLINKIANLYDKPLALIGLWHRHPGSFDQFSNTDDGTNTKYANMRKEGAISALVNIDPVFRITMYQVDKPCRYRKISYDVGDSFIPNELLKLKTSDRFNEIMNNILNSNDRRSANNGYKKTVSLFSFIKFVLPVLTNDECEDVETNNFLSEKDIQEKLIDEIMDDLTFLADTLGIETSLSLNDKFISVYQEITDKKIELQFMYSLMKKSTILSYKDKYYIYHRGLLLEAFGKAKVNKEKSDSTENIIKPKKQNGVIDSVIKIINFNRNEE